MRDMAGKKFEGERPAASRGEKIEGERPAAPRAGASGILRETPLPEFSVKVGGKRMRPRKGQFFTTRFTSLPGTTISFTTVLPSM